MRILLCVVLILVAGSRSQLTLCAACKGVDQNQRVFNRAVESGDVNEVRKAMLAPDGVSILPGLDIDKYFFRETPLIHAVCMGSKEITVLLLAHNACVDKGDREFGATALHFAVLKGDAEAVQLLVDSKASVNIKQKDKDGTSPLELLVEQERGPFTDDLKVRIATILIKAGAEYKGREVVNIELEAYARATGFPRLADYLSDLEKNGGCEMEDEPL